MPMESIELLRRMFQHAAWADRLLCDAVLAGGDDVAEATRELAHVIGAEETWLSRLEGRPSRLSVWPALDATGVAALCGETHDGYARLLDEAVPGALARNVSYRTSAGQPFTNSLGDILMHVALHGQYHRGKINLLLRQANLAPAPADYISWARGVPAAVTPRADTIAAPAHSNGATS